MDQDSNNFLLSLREGSLDGVRLIPKSDLHNHAGRGGCLATLSAWAGVAIEPAKEPFSSLTQMQEWFEQSVKVHFPGAAGYRKRIQASFVQAKEDTVRLLALSYGPDEVVALGGMEAFMNVMDAMKSACAPEIVFLPELSLNRACDTEKIYSLVEEILSYGWFASIDICCDELSQPVRAFQKIYRLAENAGIRLKAHVGEFGTADDVLEACELLHLQEVHHGIAAAKSKQVMKWLAEHAIRLNVCPASNVMLGLAGGYDTHPIRILYDNGVAVTVNTDDLLIFNQSVSQEYLNLFQSGLMTAQELDKIRITGLTL